MGHLFKISAPVLFFIPAIVYGATIGDNPGDPGTIGDNPGGGTGRPVSLINPLGEQSLIGLFNSLLDVIMIFAVPIIVFFIIYAGFQYVTARGDTTKVQNAHRALLYAVVGGVLILGAKVLLAVISGTIDSLRI